jgi:hypothetical protein
MSCAVRRSRMMYSRVRTEPSLVPVFAVPPSSLGSTRRVIDGGRPKSRREAARCRQRAVINLQCPAPTVREPDLAFASITHGSDTCPSITMMRFHLQRCRMPQCSLQPRTHRVWGDHSDLQASPLVYRVRQNHTIGFRHSITRSTRAPSAVGAISTHGLTIAAASRHPRSTLTASNIHRFQPRA